MKKQLLLALIAIAILTPQGFLSGESMWQKLKRKATITNKGHEKLYQRRKEEIKRSLGEERGIHSQSEVLSDTEKERIADTAAKHKKIDALFRRYQALRAENHRLQDLVLSKIARLDTGYYTDYGLKEKIETAINKIISASKSVLESTVKANSPNLHNPDFNVAWQLEQAALHYTFQIKLLKEEISKIANAVKIYDEFRTHFETNGLQPIRNLEQMVAAEKEEFAKHAKERELELLKMMRSARIAE
jgi:hypothetical protein